MLTEANDPAHSWAIVDDRLAFAQAKASEEIVWEHGLDEPFEATDRLPLNSDSRTEDIHPRKLAQVSGRNMLVLGLGSKAVPLWVGGLMMKHLGEH